MTYWIWKLVISASVFKVITKTNNYDLLDLELVISASVYKVMTKTNYNDLLDLELVISVPVIQVMTKTKQQWTYWIWNWFY